MYSLVLEDKPIKTIIFIIKAFLLSFVLLFIVQFLNKSIENIDWSTLRFQPVQTIVGILIIFIALYVGALGVQYAYKNLDSRKISLAQAYVLITLPSFGKYLPGKVFAITGYSIIAKKFRISIKVSSTVALLMMGLSLASMSLIGMLLLILKKQQVEIPNILFEGGASAIIIILIILLIKPDMYWKIINLPFKILKKETLINSMSRVNIIVIFTILLLHNGFYLLGVSTIVSGVVSLPFSIIPTIVGINCIAYVAGFLAFFAPAGIGVREGVCLVMLSPVVGSKNILIVTIMMRLIQTICDCIFGLLGLSIFISCTKK